MPSEIILQTVLWIVTFWLVFSVKPSKIHGIILESAVANDRNFCKCMSLSCMHRLQTLFWAQSSVSRVFCERLGRRPGEHAIYRIAGRWSPELASLTKSEKITAPLTATVINMELALIFGRHPQNQVIWGPESLTKERKQQQQHYPPFALVWSADLRYL